MASGAAHPRLPIEPFNLLIVAAVVLATLLPAGGSAAAGLHTASTLAVVLLFFWQGAKLSPEQLKQGLVHVRLHVAVFAATYGIFPLLGLALRPIALRALPPGTYDGVLFLCTSPSTIQTAVVFVAIARGNVPAALCAASLSSLAGVVLTPLWLRVLGVGVSHGAIPWSAAWDLLLQLVFPLVLGQVARRWIGAWVEGHRNALRLYDQGTIVLVVYVAFSRAVSEGLWRALSPLHFGVLVLVDMVILLCVLTATTLMSRALRFSKEDEITVVFCGSKKGLASGASIANVLFPQASVGVLLIPLMVFHQLQLMAAAALAQRYAKRSMP
jgi:sodium/bile acid cotransporter 7